MKTSNALLSLSRRGYFRCLLHLLNLLLLKRYRSIVFKLSRVIHLLPCTRTYILPFCVSCHK